MKFPAPKAALLIAIIALSVFGISQIPIGPQKDSSPASFHIVLRHYGVGAEEMETTIAIPLEIRLKDLNGLQSMNTTCEDSTATVELRFFPSTDKAKAFWEIRDRVDRLYETLPKSVQKPEITGGTADSVPVLIVSFSSPDISLDEVRDLVENGIKPLVQRLPGAGDVEVGGGRVREVHVRPREEKIAAFDLTDHSVAGIISRALVEYSAGSIHDQQTQTAVFFRSYPGSPEELGQILVPLPKGGAVRLADIADVSWGLRERENLSRSDGLEKISLYVRDNGQGNTVELCQKAIQVIASSAGHLQWQVVTDFSKDFNHSFSDLLTSLAWGLILASVTLVFFRPQLRVVLVLFFSLFLSAAATIAILPLSGFSFSAEVLAALAASFGLAVDPLIILLLTPREFPSIRSPLISAVLTTIIALAALLFQGQFQPLLPLLTLVLMGTLSMATFTAVTFLNPFQPEAQNLRPLGFVGITLSGIERFAYRVGQLAIRYPLRALVGATSLTAIAMGLFFLLQPSFANSPAYGLTTFRIDFENRATIGSVDTRITSLLANLQKVPGIERVDSFVRQGGAVITMSFDPKVCPRQQLISVAQQLTQSVSGATAYFPDANTEHTHRMEIALTGPDLDVVRKLCRSSAKSLIESGVAKDCVFHYKDFPKELVYHPNQEVLATARVQTQGYLEAFRQRQFGPVVAKVVWDSKELDIRMGQPSTEKTATDSESGVLAVDGGTGVYISHAGSFQWETEHDRIRRFDGVRGESFSIMLTTSSVSDIKRQISSVLNNFVLPEGYTFHLSHDLEETQSSFLRLFLVFGVCFVLIYLGLAIRFNSWQDPLLVLSIAPASFLPPLIYILATNSPFTVDMLVAFIAASGLVTNNAILLLETWQRSQLATPDQNLEALQRAWSIRLKPLLASSLAGILATIPLLLGNQQENELAHSLAIVVFWGVPGSLLSSLLIFPCFALGGLKWKQSKRKNVD